jgi:polysaccharide deacetylase family protein (PEP-CTERM system associated)
MPETVRPAPAITVDVEDWPQSSWDRSLPITQRAADNTRRMLDLFGSLDTRVTFFVLGKFARAFPEVVKRMEREGHEVACHGDGHEAVFKLGREGFREDVRRAKGDLEKIVGRRVEGYRAPDFSILPEQFWAFEVLADLGLVYDSSMFPIKARRYGVPDWPPYPTRLKLSGGRTLVEFPLSIVRMAGRNWPLGGGGYQRLLPGALFRALSERVMRERPFVLYCHPYEFDHREFANLEFRVPWSVRVHQGTGRRFVPARMAAFIRRFGGQPLRGMANPESLPEFEPSIIQRA